ncbi:DUF389 domain-containing protein [Nitriliruptor alkaliphilus]|uniref:DUF389 domain-containing protein n=1 Tax=Nitriliruptor alkaliphilus TaxID=427918 RepID=UPI0006983DDE|nr:DUF389 domain-containing protein [Nitriliruptor alkaliphilus]
MRIIDLTVPATRTDEFVADLSALEPLAVRLQRGASLIPRGDVVTLEVRNEQLGEVMRIADRYGLGETDGVSMSTSVPLSVVAPSHRALTREIGATTWEELELSIGEDSTMTLDRTVVMLIAGVVAGVGILTGALHVVIGAMVIAPGFQPFARFVLGVINSSGAWKGGLIDTARAYGALLVGATAAALIGGAFGAGVQHGGEDSYLAAGSLIDYWTTITWGGLVVGGAAAVCGGILISLNRTVLTAGVMVALALVPTATMVPMALVAGDPTLAASAGLRFLAEIVLVLAGTTAVFLFKRRRDRRRSSA